jgi:hypothetical protein
MDGCKIFNQVEQVSINDFYIKTDNENYFIKMPLKDLGNPKYLLSCVESRLSGETYENTAWRVIELN